MKLKSNILLLLASLLLSSQIAFAKSTPLVDIDYQFDQTKVDASANVFYFMRSFVPYYFGLIAKNSNSLNVLKNAGSYAGWCVGDAHAENFGILLQENGSSLFTMNDMDDSGPCPVVLDLFRILVSSRLYMPDINSAKIVQSYLDGLDNNSLSIPNSIKSLNKDALKAGFAIAAKDLQGNAFKRKSSMREVDAVTKEQITTLLQEQFQAEALNVLDVVSTIKIGGGSGGLQRYEVLITNNKKQLIHLELKELVLPAIVLVASETIPDQATRMIKTLQVAQGEGHSHYYKVFNFNGKSMLLRPKFAGNLGVSLADSSDHDNKEIIYFEAYVLGRLHAETVNVKDYSKALENMSAKDWEEDIASMVEVFNKRFKELRK